jgi:apolipoprotein N-acyltransferase
VHHVTELRPPARFRAALEILAGVIGSAILIALYARGGWGWCVGLLLLVPWLWSLDRGRSWTAVLASAVLMSMGYVAAALGWFGPAFGAYVGVDPWRATAILLLLAPLLQPQFLAFALLRHAVRHRGAPLAAVVGIAAWVGCEWLFPKLLGDTLGHGLQPSLTLRQAADLGGAAGLTVLLLIVNEAVSRAVSVRRAAGRPLALAVLVVGAWAGYGQWRWTTLQAALSEPAPALRIGLVQANLTDLERRRVEHGAYATVREVLDTHFAMSAHAVREQGAEALLWSETVYPTTFGAPKSEDGAAFDREIRDFVAALGTPLVFGTYDRDDAGEYNSAAVVDPKRGPLGHYRKTHLFPFTEWVPDWIDGPRFRDVFPWTGTWRPGDGPRVFPLTLADGREANVLPLICLDDVRPQLALEGARLGAQAIVGLSNDAWFTAFPQGARLHLQVATFRSIETRLPQLRATTNGLSAIVDESGEVLVHTDMGQQAVLVGEIPLRASSPTLMLRLGDWIGRAGLGVLIVLAAGWGWRRAFGGIAVIPAAPSSSEAQWPADGKVEVVWLTPMTRHAFALLRIVAALTLTWLAWRMATRDGFQVNSLDQVRGFGIGVVLPLVLAWMLRRLRAAQMSIEGDLWVLRSARQRVEIPGRNIVALHGRWTACPELAVQLGLASGRLWSGTLLVGRAQVLADLLARAGHAVGWADARSARRAEFAALRAAAAHRWLDHAALKFLLFPLLLALPAFRLHQYIAFGGSFGELYTYGVVAWLSGLLIWWAAWALGLMLLAAVLRIGIESLSWIVFRWRRTAAGSVRLHLERLSRSAYYLVTPGWLALRLLAG